jgi:Rps23 Pro-64 3,4-dihydroxylase Tpa1-like proline 4-hydroxylase
MIRPEFTGATISKTPFPHMRVPAILSAEFAASALNWLEREAPWRLRVEDFYEQEEFSLLNSQLGQGIAFLAEPSFVEEMRDVIRARFELDVAPSLIEISAHRLTPGQTIRIHNDFIDGEETHRLLIQLNDGWVSEKGGLLMLFGSSTPESVHSIVLPEHRTGFAFEISPRSFHAVSQIKHGERYTVVYSFRAQM